MPMGPRFQQKKTVEEYRQLAEKCREIAECLCGGEVDNQFKSRGLFDWQVRGLGTFEDAIDILRAASAELPPIHAV